MKVKDEEMREWLFALLDDAAVTLLQLQCGWRLPHKAHKIPKEFLKGENQA